jgi:hypothetical protein
MKNRDSLRARGTVLFLAFLLIASSVEAQSRGPSGAESPDERAGTAGGHRGAINALVYDRAEGRILSAGADGFLGIWDPERNAAVERFQLSPYSLNAMVLRPGKTQIALIEGDGLGVYRISAWDYKTKEKFFILRFRDPISYITYSAGGNFLIVSRSAQTGAVFLHPETGEVLQSPESLSGSVSFAATGRSERTMIVYSPAGALSYWELDSGVEIRHFAIPQNITSPILFGNNRFFGGFDSYGGLVVLDAVLGIELARERRITGGLLLPGNGEQGEFISLSTERGVAVLNRLGVGATRVLETKERRTLPADTPPISSIAAAGDAIALGTAEGGVLTVRQTGDPVPMNTARRIRVREANVSGSILAFITERNTTGFIPLDFTALRDKDIIALENSGNYTHIESLSPDLYSDGTFIFWQSGNPQPYPLIRSITATDSETPDNRTLLSKLSVRFPLRSVSALHRSILFLDSVGNITVFSVDTGEVELSFASAGSLDAAFLDGDTIVIGRSAVSGHTPFLKVLIRTGETVSMPYPASIGAQVYRGESGTLYGAAIDGSSSIAKTVILEIDPKNPASSVRLVEYQGEDTSFAIAESGGALAATIGGDGVALYSREEFIPFERSPGLPIRLIGGGGYFITTDEDGNIAWYENQTGKLAAMLYLREDEWLLETSGGKTTGGRIFTADSDAPAY